MNEFDTATDTDVPADRGPSDGAPRAGNHGADVSAVAHAPDPTPETNHGADVSATAKANHGHDAAADHGRARSGKGGNGGKARGHK